MKKVGKFLALSSIAISAMIAAPLLTRTESNSGINEQALDLGTNGSLVNLVRGQVLGKDESVSVSKTFVQHGVTTYEGNEIKVLRFATAIKGQINSLNYTRDHIDGLDDISIDVTTVYRSLSSNGKKVYYDPSASSNGLTTDASYADNYYWACYVIRYESGDTYKDTDFTVRLNVNGEEAAVTTRSLTEVMQASVLCSHDLAYTAPVAATRHVNGTLGYYTCAECNKVFEDADALVETTVKDRVDVSEGWTKFVPGHELGGNTGATSTSATLDGEAATKITLPSGMASGTTFNIIPKSDRTPNQRVMLFKDVNTKFKLTVKNESGISVDFRYFFDNYGDKLGYDMHVEANETKTFEFEGAFDNTTPGPWNGIKVNTDLTEDVNLYIHGEYTTNGKVDGEEIVMEPSYEVTNKSFIVGETFNTNGLMVRLNGGIATNDWPNIDSYVTNYDGYTFTDADLGTRTVEVKFGGSSFTYDIEVISGHELTYVEKVEATTWANGVEAHYECTECGKCFSDEEAKHEISKDSVKLSKGAWVRFINNVSYIDGGDSKVSAQHIEVQDEIFPEAGTIKAAEISINGDLSTGTTWQHPNNWDDNKALDGSFNTRFPMVPGGSVDYKFFYKNTGTSSISLAYQLWNDGPNTKVVTIELAPGEQKIVTGTYTSTYNTGGGWVRYHVTDAISAGAKLVTYAYYSTSNNDYFEYGGNGSNALTVEKARDPLETTFNVGETFTAEGLALRLKSKLTGGEGNTGFVYNFTTNYDGHTFTSDDVGTKTVVVRFGDYKYTYDIRVSSGHNLTYVEKVEATTWSNGAEAHYECLDCGKWFLDQAGVQEISKASARLTEGAWVRFINNANVYDNNNVTAQHIEVQDEIFPEAGTIKAAEISINGNLSAGEIWQHPNNWDDNKALDGSFNTRFPMVPGGSVDYKFFYKNTGTSSISLAYQLWNDGPNTKVVTVELAPGEQKIVSGTYTSTYNTGGGWVKYHVTDSIPAGAKLVTYAYYSTSNNDYFEYDGTSENALKVSQARAASKTTFNVGETFTAEGLALKLSSNLNGGSTAGYVYNFDTNFDGHTFTAEDVGTRAVIVRFGDATVTYNITIEA